MMVPTVSRSRRREASGIIEDLTACFDGLADPRVTRRCDHRLIDILVIAVSAVIACAESWEDIELYGRSKQAWLKTFLALPNGIPSHDTFRRVFMLLDPNAFEGCFAQWAQSLTSKVEREVVAIDGKTVRRSGSSRHDQGPVLGQREVDGKSNEITAIPELLDTLHLDGSIVTLDATGCQKVNRPSAPWPRNETASSSGFFTGIGATQSRADTCKQLIRIKWLAQIADDAGTEDAGPDTVIGIRGNKDCRNGVSGLDQPAVQLDTRHRRHLDIGDQAGGVGKVPRCKES
jgi:predicted transposase YbfD/YdcC